MPFTSKTKAVVNRTITITLTADNRLKFVSDDATVTDWYIPLAGAEIQGMLDKAYASHVAAGLLGESVYPKQDNGPRVILRQQSGNDNIIFLDRIKAAGAFAAWTPGVNQAALDAFIVILEGLA